jgi:hypothetical protein
MAADNWEGDNKSRWHCINSQEIILEPDAAASAQISYSATFVQSKFAHEQALLLRSFYLLDIASPHPDGYFTFFGLQDAPEVDA